MSYPENGSRSRVRSALTRVCASRAVPKGSLSPPLETRQKWFPFIPGSAPNLEDHAIAFGDGAWVLQPRPLGDGLRGLLIMNFYRDNIVNYFFIKRLDPQRSLRITGDDVVCEFMNFYNPYQDMCLRS